MKRLSVLILASFLLSGCTAIALTQTDALGIFRDEEVNITQRNYAAADYLIQQARTFIGRRDLLTAETLTDKDEARVHSALGRMIPQQVGVRLSQLGYKVNLDQVTVAGEESNYLNSATIKNEKPDFILSGTYLRRPQELDVNLRIIEIGTGRIVAVFDYIMPMNREIAELSEPEARIYKVGQ